VAKSVEVWQDGQIVGGLYGIDMGHVFVEKACFLKVSNAKLLLLFP
jgi:leucyl/phenylalanyl-tRNA--protein transferase